MDMDDEKYFVATPCMPNTILSCISLFNQGENCTASYKILLKLKDFEGICVHASRIQLQLSNAFSGSGFEGWCLVVFLFEQVTLRP
jgi:hypothetical protein